MRSDDAEAQPSILTLRNSKILVRISWLVIHYADSFIVDIVEEEKA